MRTIIDVDDEFLAAAQADLGTATKKDTVNEALRYVAARRARARAVLMTPTSAVARPDGSEVMRGARR